jgi:hypothetical protein
VVHEHQAYQEGIKRALYEQRASWQLHLLNNRDTVRARGVSRSHWRPGLVGATTFEGIPVTKPRQINVNPYEGPEGDSSTRPKAKAYKTKTREQLDDWVVKVDNLQKPWGAAKA